MVCLIGASGHGKVVYSVLQEVGYNISCFFDDNKSLKSILGKPVVNELIDISDEVTDYFISIGNNHIRKLKSTQFKGPFLSAIHPTSVVHPSVKVDVGTVVMHQATIQIDTIVGKHSIINTGAVVDHDCIIHDFVHIGPNATLCGGVEVGEGSLIGAGSTIIPLVKIGNWCTVGAGSVVINDLPDYSVAVGSPAKVIKVNQSS